MNEPGNLVEVRWKAPGPVSAAFMASQPIMGGLHAINGPVGSGKTSTDFVKAIRVASKQAPSPRRRARRADGTLVPVRMVKMCVVRDTYRQLWKTTLPSWWKRVPKEFGDWNGPEGGPASHRVPFDFGDGTVIDFQVDFIAIADKAIEDVMRGYEPTFWFLNEFDLLPREVYTYAKGRAGRYPDMADGGPTWYGMLGDCNAPEESSWVYKDFFNKSEAELEALNVRLFIQPSGLSPEAENIENLPPGYYQNQIVGAPDWYVERMVKNVPGFSRSGKPIYTDFNDKLHVTKDELAPIPGLPIHIGLDAGLDPAAVIGQKLGDGRWHILDELISEHGTGAKRFSRNLNELLKDRYEGWPVERIKAWADPSAAYGADKQEDEESWLDIVSNQTAIPVRAAPTNALTDRLEAVRQVLTLMPDGRPAFVLSARCKTLREGFNSGYRFRKLNVPGSDRYTDEPDKNEFSHPHDALQYLMLGGGEHAAVHGRRQENANASRQTHAQDDWGLPS